jgi:hypothetical protein
VRNSVAFIIMGILSLPGAVAAPRAASNVGLATSVTKTKSEGKSAKEGLKLDLGAQASSTLKSPTDPHRRDAIDLDFMPAYALSEELRLSARTLLLNSVSRQGSALFSDTSVTLRHSQIAAADDFSLGLAGGMLLPTHPISRRSDSLVFALRAAPAIEYRPAGTGNELRMSYELGATRTFYQYGTTEFGEPNTANLLSHTGRLSFSPAPRLSLRATFIYFSRWAYEGQRTNALDFYLEESWELQPELTLGLGITNSGNPVLPKPDDSNFSLKSLQAPTVYGTVGYAL